jgi:hypothetical protein
MVGRLRRTSGLLAACVVRCGASRGTACCAVCATPVHCRAMCSAVHVGQAAGDVGQEQRHAGRQRKGANHHLAKAVHAPLPRRHAAVLHSGAGLGRGRAARRPRPALRQLAEGAAGGAQAWWAGLRVGRRRGGRSWAWAIARGGWYGSGVGRGAGGTSWRTLIRACGCEGYSLVGRFRRRCMHGSRCMHTQCAACSERTYGSARVSLFSQTLEPPLRPVSVSLTSARSLIPCTQPAACST